MSSREPTAAYCHYCESDHPLGGKCVSPTGLRFSERMIRDKAQRVLASPDDFAATTVEFAGYLITLLRRIGRMRHARA